MLRPARTLAGETWIRTGPIGACGARVAVVVDVVADAGRLGAGLDWKTSLQELSAARLLGPPAYLISSTGPDHDKEFTATLGVFKRIRRGDTSFKSN